LIVNWQQVLQPNLNYIFDYMIGESYLFRKDGELEQALSIKENPY